VRGPQQVHELVLVLGAARRRHLPQPALLLLVRLVRQGDAQLGRDDPDAFVEVGVADDEMVAGLLDGLARRALQGLLPGRQLPQSGQPHPHDQIAVGGGERAPLGVHGPRRHVRLTGARPVGVRPHGERDRPDGGDEGRDEEGRAVDPHALQRSLPGETDWSTAR
jgi:hypothetical protein